MPDRFFMLRLRLHARTLAVLAQRRRLPVQVDDSGYLVHSFLRELFGEMAPSPFSIEKESNRMVKVLAYSDLPAVQLHERASIFADPFHYSDVDWASFAAKPMPNRWKIGQRPGFKIRFCPVVRRAKAGPRGEAQGREMDVFLAKLEARPAAHVDRYATYLEWLEQALARSSGASLVAASVEAFRLRRLLRRDRSREARPVPERRSSHRGSVGKPDVVLRGELTVVEPESFSAFVRRGVGRHRAFGFGMVLLLPPGVGKC